MYFLFRILQGLTYIVAAGLAVAAFVYVVSNVIQFVGNLLGFELGSLWDWVVSKLPERKPKPKK